LKARPGLQAAGRKKTARWADSAYREVCLSFHDKTNFFLQIEATGFIACRLFKNQEGRVL